MSAKLHQGDVIKIERIKHPVLVVSKDFFNSSGEMIGCPIYENGTESPLHIAVEAEHVRGYVQCEKLALLDLKVRGYKKTGQILLKDLILICGGKGFGGKGLRPPQAPCSRRGGNQDDR